MTEGAADELVTYISSPSAISSPFFPAVAAALFSHLSALHLFVHAGILKRCVSLFSSRRQRNLFWSVWGVSLQSSIGTIHIVRQLHNTPICHRNQVLTQRRNTAKSMPDTRDIV